MIASPPSQSAPSYRLILALAWPAILANAAVPLLGLADTAVIGRVGQAHDLGAVALGALVFNCIYWGLGFLRMSTTGLVAQAHGARRPSDVVLVVGRALPFALLLGVVIVLLQGPLNEGALSLLGASDAVNAVVRDYVGARIWGAPATLLTMVVSGCLIGLGRMRALLALQLFLNGSNLALNLVFVLSFDLGVQGLGIGTALAEWSAFLLGFWLLGRAGVPARAVLAQRSALADRSEWLRLFSVNGHIFVRTLAMLIGFGWFSRQGAGMGDGVLAGNHVLQQLISFSAFFLDGVAFVAESLVGAAFGARDRAYFVRVVKRTSLVALGFGAGLAASILGLGPRSIDGLATIPEVRAVAFAHLPFAAAYVLLAIAAWQLDGIFIGATASRELRNASLVSLGVFLVIGNWLAAAHGNAGLWAAMLCYAALRGLTLMAYYPRLLRKVTDEAR